ncbi:threonine ammonia-lyase, biosynthetic [Phakopsora pachyrhizi]|uniref:Threonine dehydratase n=1 Tax=Phakopsora pachyrhizi TaxID=170000 RepID=A0AAV0BHF4_PHAPC|nr:threonine ammonia-lyase, biosynthetic [Phakopsora pachyrhizi]
MIISSKNQIISNPFACCAFKFSNASSSQTSTISAKTNQAIHDNDSGSNDEDSDDPNQLPIHLYSRIPARQLLTDGSPDYLKLILSSKVYDLVKETPLVEALNLSNRLGVWVGMKREDLQPVFSFKIRGAYNLMAHLTEEEKSKGVIACSAGNHAQGVAMSAQALGIKATIVMPLATPSIKFKNVARLGASVLLHGNDFDEAKLECHRLSVEKGLINIPPFDDPYVIAGQGTIGLEILNQVNMQSLDAIFVCVGGGGLLAGIAAYVKKIAPPGLKVIGVECQDQSAMTDSIAAGRRLTLDQVGLFSDGTAVRVVGRETFRISRSLVDEMILVSNDEICAGIKDVFEDTRSIPEPAGALAIAGLKRYLQTHNLFGSGKRYVCIVSGANMNFDRLRFVAERADLGENREALLSVVVPEKPGSFVKLHSYLHPRLITEFSYRYSTSSQAYIFVSFNLNSSSNDPNITPAQARQQEISSLCEAIQSDPLGMKPKDISDNEMAKSHARYLIGGRVCVEDERLIAFEFPERPGALKKFLAGLGGADSNNSRPFNVTLFHYRNHGGDMSRVLTGIQVPDGDSDRFEMFLKDLGYSFTDETKNEIHKEYLLPYKSE